MSRILPARTTFYLGETSREVLGAAEDKPSHRLEWMCCVYQQATQQALPRLKLAEWTWLCQILAGLDVRSVDHLALIIERARSTAGGSSGIDSLGVSTRLAALPIAGRAGVWDFVRSANKLASEGGDQIGNVLERILPKAAILTG